MARPQKSPYPRELYQSPLYRAWRNMINRCDNPNYTNYKYWGGRGISYSKGWNSFSVFLKDMQSGYAIGLQLDRIDNNANYSKNNCHWVSRVEQSRNRRNNHWVEINGVSKTLVEWIELSGIKKSTVSMRLKYGWPIKKALGMGVYHR